MSKTDKSSDGDTVGGDKIVHGDIVHGDKIAGNKVTVGNITGSGSVNIAGGDIRLNTTPSSNVPQNSQSSLPEVSILFLAADPTDAARLRLGAESREIGEKLRLSKLRDRFRLSQRMSVRPEDISQALLDEQPQIVHFSGHGAATGELAFENQSGQAFPVGPDALAALFEQFADQVKCVVLNACYAEIQAKAIAKHIDHVIGMGDKISDKASIAFSVGFYQALGAGRNYEDAYKLGCVQIRLQGIPEHLTPVLIKRVE